MTKKGKEAYQNYQERKKVVKQAIRDRRNQSYRTYLDRDFTLVDDNIPIKPPEIRINYILSRFYFNY